jgi:hypothetical protein
MFGREFMNIPFFGGCVCGAVRYECSAKPVAMFKCHCRDCQRVSGGPYSAVILMLAPDFRLTKGQLRFYSTRSLKGGDHKRGFCPECGSRITGSPSEKIGLLAGSLDDSTWFQPTMEIFTCDVQPWDHVDSNAVLFEQYPTPK